MKILDDKKIRQKITRLAHEIAENNYQKSEIILCGINKNGLRFAHLIEEQLSKIVESTVIVNQIMVNAASPTQSDVQLENEISYQENQSIIIVDDVANTGRTIFYAFTPFFDHPIEQLQVAVLVDRKHKYFPIEVTYVGLSLATTIGQNIEVNFLDSKAMEVHLN